MNDLAYILLGVDFPTPCRISLFRFLLQRCTFLDHFGALLAPFPALRTNERRTSRPSQPRPRAGRFSARGRARRASSLQHVIICYVGVGGGWGSGAPPTGFEPEAREGGSV